MAMKKFRVTLIADVSIEIDEAVIATALTEEWRKQFFNFTTPSEVAAHIAYNMVVNDISLGAIDGFGGQKTSAARIKRLDWSNWSAEAAVVPK